MTDTDVQLLLFDLALIIVLGPAARRGWPGGSGSRRCSARSSRASCSGRRSGARRSPATLFPATLIPPLTALADLGLVLLHVRGRL